MASPVAADPPALPDDLDHARRVELRGRSAEPWVRRIILLVLLAVVLAGLANVFGQQDRTSSASAAAGRVRVSAPDHLRGGLITVRLQFEVNPQATGSRDQSVILQDGDALIARIDRHVIVFP